MSLPNSVQELWSVWRELEGRAQHPVLVNLLGAAGSARDDVRAMLLQHSDKPGSLRVADFSGEMPPEADVHLVLVDPLSGLSAPQRDVLRRMNPRDLLVMLVGAPEGEAESRRREIAASLGLSADRVIVVPGVTQLRAELMGRMLEVFEDYNIPLARQLPFLREEAARREIEATSRQNAMVGVIPIPGADMPIMTGNQVKMVVRLAAIYDLPMTFDRLKEVLAVLGGAFALRTAGRQVVKLIPGAGWLVGGAMGYVGTRGMGMAAQEYFRRGGMPSDGPTPPRVERSAAPTEPTP